MLSSFAITSRSVQAKLQLRYGKEENVALLGENRTHSKCSHASEWDPRVSEVKESARGTGGKKFLGEVIPPLRKMEILHPCEEQEEEEEM